MVKNKFVFHLCNQCLGIVVAKLSENCQIEKSHKLVEVSPAEGPCIRLRDLWPANLGVVSWLGKEKTNLVAFCGLQNLATFSGVG